jgi:HPt (histidine-containing phosphotransfer) domain-containing protein
MRTHPGGVAVAKARYKLCSDHGAATSYGASFALHATKALNNFSAAERNTRIDIASDASVQLLLTDTDVFRLLNTLVKRLSVCSDSVIVVSLQNDESTSPFFAIKLVPNVMSSANREIENSAEVPAEDRDLHRALDLVLKSSVRELNRLAQRMSASLSYERVKSNHSEIRLQLHPIYRREALDRKYSATLSIDVDSRSVKHLLIATRCPDDISRSIESLSGKYCTVTCVDNMYDAREIARCFKIDALFIDRRTIACSDGTVLFDVENEKGTCTQPSQIFAYGTFRMVSARDVWTLDHIVANLGLISSQAEVSRPSYCFEIIPNLDAHRHTDFSNSIVPQELDFDLERLGELMGILKPPKFLSISRQFLGDISRIIEIDAEKALELNAEDYLGQFHKLGSSAGFFGAIDLRDVCYDLQDSLRLNDPLANRSGLLLFDKLANSAVVQLQILNELVEATVGVQSPELEPGPAYQILDQSDDCITGEESVHPTSS